jgi:NAD+ synthase (glutamine-hydrolysing)
VVDLDRTRRMRQENTTWRTDLEAFQARHPPIPVIRSEAKTADRSRLRYPPPLGDSFFLPAPGSTGPDPRDEVLDDLISALSMGIRDYYRKTGAFRCIGVALSGGRDSMLTLLLAWRAALLLDAKVGETVQAFNMPTRFSGEGTRGAAAKLCEELGIPLHVVPIEEAFDREVEAARQMLGGAEPTEITLQNIQARLRSARMWNWANTAGGLFLQTGDMSEKAVGYTTIGGDLEGALSVIANIPKTVVIALLERFHRLYNLEGVAQTLATAPGPELAEAQVAEEELMPFPVLDACLHLYAGEKLAPDEVSRALAALFPDLDPGRLDGWAKRFSTLFTRSIYKWVQSPLSLHVGSLDLDRERALQLPVVQRNDWSG